jgi:hypothetical protein
MIGMQGLPYLVHDWHTLWHSVRGISWGAWSAAVALIVGAGAFLDEYYVGDSVRDTTRQRLGAWLQRLDCPRSKFKELLDNLKLAVIFTAISFLLVSYIAIDYALWKRGAHFVSIVLFGLAILFAPVFAVAAIPFFLWSLLAVLSVLLTLTFKLIEALIWLVFKPAADPKRSPFKFATAMVGLWILAAKFCLELTK